MQCGKTKATRAALSLLGVASSNFFSDMSDSRAFEFTSQTTLGMVIDDPEDLKQVAKKLTYHFQKSHASTKMYSYQPRTTFITSMNERMLRKVSIHARYDNFMCFHGSYFTDDSLYPACRLISRAVLIQFKEVCTRSAEEQDTLDIAFDEAMKNAHGAAGLIISLGGDLESKRQELISSVLPHVAQALPGAINRVHRSYALVIFAALQVHV